MPRIVQMPRNRPICVARAHTVTQGEGALPTVAQGESALPTVAQGESDLPTAKLRSKGALALARQADAK